MTISPGCAPCSVSETSVGFRVPIRRLPFALLYPAGPGSRLVEWLERNPRYGGSCQALAIDMARLEWAHIEAFDNAAEKELAPGDLLELGPDFRARLSPTSVYLGLSIR